MPYVFDTSSIRVLEHYYPDGFPTFWRLFDESVESGAIISVREVYNEVEKQIRRDWFADWVKAHKSMFLTPDAEETKFVGEIFAVNHFQALVGEAQRLKGQPVADPFVIASAQVRGGTVVTEEAMKPHAARIPNVCEHFGIPCTNVEGFLAKNGWQF